MICHSRVDPASLSRLTRPEAQISNVKPYAIEHSGMLISRTQRIVKHPN